MLEGPGGRKAAPVEDEVGSVAEENTVVTWAKAAVVALVLVVVA